jgi:hypothetical protein
MPHLELPLLTVSTTHSLVNHLGNCPCSECTSQWHVAFWKSSTHERDMLDEVEQASAGEESAEK